MGFNIVIQNIEQYANFAAFPVVGESNILYIDEATSAAYYWDGAAYSSVSGGGGVYGTEYHYAESEAESNTTSGTYQLKTTLTTGTLPSGNYSIFWYSETRNSSTSGIVDIRVRYGTTEIGQTEIEHEDTSDWNPQGGFKSDISLSGVQTIELHYRRIDNGTATIRRSRLKLIRVS